MRPAVLTVLPGGIWEPPLVDWARITGGARILGRCGSPAEIERRLGSTDVILVGDDTSWVGAGMVHHWRALGVTVIGIADQGATGYMRAIGCDMVIPDDWSPHALITAVTATRPGPAPTPLGDLVSVTGPRGAPGRTEVSLALAWALSETHPTLLVELDCGAPSLGLRTGLSPRLDITDADPATGAPLGFGRLGCLRVISAPLHPGPLASSVTHRVIAAARAEPSIVVADLGPEPKDSTDPSTSVLVCEPSDGGLTRAARLLTDWMKEPPLLVVNQPRGGRVTQADVRRVRRATGLEPTVTIDHLPRLKWGTPPPAELVDRVRPLAEAVVGQRALR